MDDETGNSSSCPWWPAIGCRSRLTQSSRRRDCCSVCCPSLPRRGLTLSAIKRSLQQGSNTHERRAAVGSPADRQVCLNRESDWGVRRVGRALNNSLKGSPNFRCMAIRHGRWTHLPIDDGLRGKARGRW